ncbi:MAG: dTDP-4-dehydrorhamnose reductase [Planctomycetaceae bacterium]
MATRIAILGAGGQLGSELVHLAGDDALPIDRSQLDVVDPVAVAGVLDALAPTHVINATAYNRVDDAEAAPEAAFAVNAHAPLHIAGWCEARDVPLLHVSTDYVFGGDRARRTPFIESDTPAPVSVYGLSKLTGEHAVRLRTSRHFIVRTCGLYGRQATRSKGNFVQTILRLAAERDRLEIVDDQRCTPTPTAVLAPLLLRLIQTNEYGLYHATSGGDCSWFEFAREIVRLKGLVVDVVPTTSDKFVRPARRPGYSVLCCDKLAATLGERPSHWRESLATFLEANLR